MRVSLFNRKGRPRPLIAFLPALLLRPGRRPPRIPR